MATNMGDKAISGKVFHFTEQLSFQDSGGKMGSHPSTTKESSRDGNIDLSWCNRAQLQPLWLIIRFSNSFQFA
jgi:hypothetical protein